ncbi:uncharacterized protein LOC128883270 [Hylaeus volcanicus]|uniref:uncharacterized protein LOC128883270 n=1 Tax=Hylaeus volcanicus TaxID=313075 RepID=UPI0023B7851F|nr:uncharacterized protein LOC128883270 [Hylaeus volcanicus]
MDDESESAGDTESMKEEYMYKTDDAKLCSTQSVSSNLHNNSNLDETLQTFLIENTVNDLKSALNDDIKSQSTSFSGSNQYFCSQAIPVSCNNEATIKPLTFCLSPDSYALTLNKKPSPEKIVFNSNDIATKIINTMNKNTFNTATQINNQPFNNESYTTTEHHGENTLNNVARRHPNINILAQFPLKTHHSICKTPSPHKRNHNEILTLVSNNKDVVDCASYYENSYPLPNDVSNSPSTTHLNKSSEEVSCHGFQTSLCNLRHSPKDLDKNLSQRELVQSNTLISMTTTSQLDSPVTVKSPTHHDSLTKQNSSCQPNSLEKMEILVNTKSSLSIMETPKLKSYLPMSCSLHLNSGCKINEEKNLDSSSNDSLSNVASCFLVNLPAPQNSSPSMCSISENNLISQIVPSSQSNIFSKNDSPSQIPFTHEMDCSSKSQTLHKINSSTTNSFACQPKRSLSTRHFSIEKLPSLTKSSFREESLFEEPSHKKEVSLLDETFFTGMSSVTQETCEATNFHSLNELSPSKKTYCNTHTLLNQNSFLVQDSCSPKASFSQMKSRLIEKNAFDKSRFSNNDTDIKTSSSYSKMPSFHELALKKESVSNANSFSCMTTTEEHQMPLQEDITSSRTSTETKYDHNQLTNLSNSLLEQLTAAASAVNYHSESSRKIMATESPLEYRRERFFSPPVGKLHDPETYGINLSICGELVSAADVVVWEFPNLQKLHQLRHRLVSFMRDNHLKQADICRFTGLSAPYLSFMVKDPTIPNFACRRRVEVFSMLTAFFQKIDSQQITMDEISTLVLLSKATARAAYSTRKQCHLTSKQNVAHNEFLGLNKFGDNSKLPEKQAIVHRRSRGRPKTVDCEMEILRRKKIVKAGVVSYNHICESSRHMYSSTFDPLDDKSERNLPQSPIDQYSDAQDTLPAALCNSFEKSESHLNSGSKYLQSHNACSALIPFVSGSSPRILDRTKETVSETATKYSCNMAMDFKEKDECDMTAYASKPKTSATRVKQHLLTRVNISNHLIPHVKSESILKGISCVESYKIITPANQIGQHVQDSNELHEQQSQINSGHLNSKLQDLIHNETCGLQKGSNLLEASFNTDQMTSLENSVGVNGLNQLRQQGHTELEFPVPIDYSKSILSSKTSKFNLVDGVDIQTKSVSSCESTDTSIPTHTLENTHHVNTSFRSSEGTFRKQGYQVAHFNTPVRETQQVANALSNDTCCKYVIHFGPTWEKEIGSIIKSEGCESYSNHKCASNTNREPNSVKSVCTDSNSKEACPPVVFPYSGNLCVIQLEWNYNEQNKKIDIVWDMDESDDAVDVFVKTFTETLGLPMIPVGEAVLSSFYSQLNSVRSFDTLYLTVCRYLLSRLGKNHKLHDLPGLSRKIIIDYVHQGVRIIEIILWNLANNVADGKVILQQVLHNANFSSSYWTNLFPTFVRIVYQEKLNFIRECNALLLENISAEIDFKKKSLQVPNFNNTSKKEPVDISPAYAALDSSYSSLNSKKRHCEPSIHNGTHTPYRHETKKSCVEQKVPNDTFHR